MHKSTLKVLALSVLTLALVVFLGACGSSDNAAETETNANVADVMQAAQEKLDSVSSMTCDMRMDMEMSADGQNIQTSIYGVSDMINDPMTMKMDMTMNIGEMDMDMQVYAAEENGAYTIYTGMDDGTGTMNWSKQSVADMDTLKQYQAKDNMNMYLDAIDSFKEAGVEKVNGSEATRYDGIIANDSLNEVMASSGMLDQFAQMGYDKAEMEAMYSNLGDLPIKIWIDNESGMPVQYHMNMTEIMQSLMANMASDDEDAGAVTIDSVTLGMTMYNFDGVDSIEIPEEALNASANE